MSAAASYTTLSAALPCVALTTASASSKRCGTSAYADLVAQRDAAADAQLAGEVLEPGPLRTAVVGRRRPVEHERRLRQLRQRAQDSVPTLDRRIATEPEQTPERCNAFGDASQRVDVDPVPDRAHLRRPQRNGAHVHGQDRIDDACRRIEQVPDFPVA